MRIRRSRKTLRGAGVLAVLACSALLISGCVWATEVHHARNPDKWMVLKPSISDRIVFNCTRDFGSGQARGSCASRVVVALCDGAPVGGLTDHQCRTGDSADVLEGSIVEFLREGGDCLRKWIDYGDVGGFPTTLYSWDAVPEGAEGCRT
jgi:hypothetical protein